MRGRIVLCLGLLIVFGSALPAAAHVTQHCTVGFYKNHSQFLNSGTCTNPSFTKDTVVSTVFPDVDSCVGAMTFLQLISAPSNACGAASSLAGGEIILLRQAIARLANAANSNPPSCDAVGGTTAKTNATIDDAIATDNRNELTALGAIYDTLNNGDCTLH